MISASGVSADINPKYAVLYEQDAAATGEQHTYYSRGANGEALYRTHHFEYEELHRLLDECGFETTGLHKEKEASSRRPQEPAWFLYATAIKRADLPVPM